MRRNKDLNSLYLQYEYQKNLEHIKEECVLHYFPLLDTNMYLCHTAVYNMFQERFAPQCVKLFWLTCARFTLILLSQKDSLHHQFPRGVTLVLQFWTIVCFPCSKNGQHKKQTHQVKLKKKSKHCIYMEDCTFLCSFLKQHTRSQSIFEDGRKATRFKFLMVKHTL